MKILKEIIQLEFAEIFYGVGSLLIGGLIGAIIENQLSSGVDPKYLAVLGLGIILAVILIIVFSYWKRQDEHNSNIIEILKTVKNAVGIDVEYQNLKSLGSKDIIDRAKYIMSSAEIEILEITLIDPFLYDINPDLPSQDLRRNYYQSIVNHLHERKSQNNTIVYKRICQFPKEMNFDTLRDKIFIAHCKDLAELNRKSGYQCYLKKTLISSPISYSIIDRKYLILSVDEFRQKGEIIVRIPKGELIIYDPQRQIIDVFLSEWRRIENSHHTQTLTIDEFNY